MPLRLHQTRYKNRHTYSKVPVHWSSTAEFIYICGTCFIFEKCLFQWCKSGECIFSEDAPSYSGKIIFLIIPSNGPLHIFICSETFYSVILCKKSTHFYGLIISFFQLEIMFKIVLTSQLHLSFENKGLLDVLILTKPKTQKTFNSLLSELRF